MSNKQKIILLVLGILIVAAGVFAFVYQRKKAEKQVPQDINQLLLNLARKAPEAPEEALNINLNTNIKTQKPVKPLSEEEKTKAELLTLSSTFVERFGSYSNQSDFENIIELKVFMTEKMKKWADQYREELRSKSGTRDIYFGITTKAFKSELKNFNLSQGEATYLVATQRVESIGSPSNSKVYNQEIEIKFKKETGNWKVDGAYWR